MKKFMSFVLMTVFAVALTGCVTIEEDPYEVDCDEYPNHVSCIDDSQTPEGEAPGVINVLPELPSEDIDITFWHVYGETKGALLDEMIAEFMEMYPNINVTSVSQGNYDTIRTNTLNAITAGDTPHVVVGYPDH